MPCLEAPDLHLDPTVDDQPVDIRAARFDAGRRYGTNRFQVCGTSSTLYASAMHYRPCRRGHGSVACFSGPLDVKRNSELAAWLSGGVAWLSPSSLGIA
jgi:hypothetical protein